MLEKLKASLEASPIIRRGEYNYFIHFISDGIPGIDPEVMNEIADYIIKNGDMNVSKIVTIEAMGIPIAMAISMKTGIPVNIIRKREYKLPGEIILSQATGYSKGTLYINGIEKGERVLFVDDVISTGGSLLPVVKAIEGAGAHVAGAFCVIGRGNGAERVEKETGVPVKVLVYLDVDENGVHVTGGV